MMQPIKIEKTNVKLSDTVNQMVSDRNTKRDKYFTTKIALTIY